MVARHLLASALAVLFLASAPGSWGQTAPTATDSHPSFVGVWIVSNRSSRGFLDEALQPLTSLPLTPKAAETKRKADLALDPSAKCLPGMPRHMNGPYPIQILQSPAVTALLFEYDNVFRLIYTDGRGREADEETSYLGRSLGRWDGDTLVVETAGVSSEVWLDAAGTPVSPKMVLTERFSLQDGGKTLQDIIKIDDPEVFTQPVYRKVIYNLKPTWELKEYICESGNRDNVFNQKPGNPGSLTTTKPAGKKTR